MTYIFITYLLHNRSLFSKVPKDSVVVLIENLIFFSVLNSDFWHESDEILCGFSFDSIIMAVFWVSDLMLHEFEWFPTYNLQSKTLLQFLKTNFSHQPSYRLSLIYYIIVYFLIFCNFHFHKSLQLGWCDKIWRPNFCTVYRK